MEITKQQKQKTLWNHLIHELINIYGPMPFLILFILRNVTLLDMPIRSPARPQILSKEQL